MQIDNCPENVLEKVLDRIHLEEMGTVKRYKQLAIQSGLQLVSADEMPDQLEKHYIKVLEG
jgi:hypothetical protein